MILVQRRDYHNATDLEEIESLARTAGHEVLGCLTQTREPDPAFQIGKGKVDELAELVRAREAEKIVFDNELTPIQTYNIAKLTKVEVTDRYRLILETFQKRATTREAQLQIKLAEFRYEFPRVRENIRLARSGEQPGFMGMGQYEVDAYADHMKRQMAQIRRELKKIREKRRIHRSRRRESGFPLVSLAGYTNSGKSTLFNALTEEDAAVDKTLFTTLTTTTRKVDFGVEKLLLTDTVGFIDRLPIELIEAFHSTLEETIVSDLIILLLDMSDPIAEIQRKLRVCLNTINEIGVMGIPIVTALNKIDLVDASVLDTRIGILRDRLSNPIPISAKKDLNIDSLKKKVVEVLGNQVEASLILPNDSEGMVLLSELYERANISSVVYDESIRVTVSSSLGYLRLFESRIRALQERFQTTDSPDD